MEYTHPEDFVVAAILNNESARSHQLVLTRDERHRVSRTGADLSDLLVPNSLHSLGEPAGDDTGMTPDFHGGETLFEELEFSSQIPQRDFARPEYLPPEGCEDDYEELLPAPAKRPRLGDFSPVVDPRFEFPLVSADSNRMPHTVLSPTEEPTSPRRAEPPNDCHFPPPPLAPQNTHALPDTTSCPRVPIPPSIPDIVQRSVPPGTERATAHTTERRQDLAEFLALRGVHPSVPPATTAAETAIDDPPPTEVPQSPQRLLTEIPPGLIDKHTIQLPADNSLPISRHQYLASLDLLQKYALCRCLSDGPAAIDLIEREFLGGVDLILDQDTAILFVPLSTVPSECEGLIAGISDISWRYSHILVIFEAFLISQAFGDGEENQIVSFTFTEPILKSVKKLKRSLAIAEGVGTKAEDCSASWAFAKNIEEAASLARAYGDVAESRDNVGGLLWQERWWLGERESEDSPLSEFQVRPPCSVQKATLASWCVQDESELAMVAGMNAFAACLILSQMSSDQFLSLMPQERTERFGQLLGTKRMVRFRSLLAAAIG